MALQLSIDSKEYVKVQVDAVKNGASYNPTGDTVEFAFTEQEDLDGATWYAASWEANNGCYFARCLVGPGGGVVTFTEGNWLVWVRITDNPETPIKRAGWIEAI